MKNTHSKVGASTGSENIGNAVNAAATSGTGQTDSAGGVFGRLRLFVITSLLAFAMGMQATAQTFPATAITGKDSTSVYATTKNAFYASDPTLAGQCTWYTYGRVVELAEGGYLDTSAATLMYTAFWGQSGRHARNWPSFIGGEWTATSGTPLPMEKRKPGMLVVWAPADTTNPGHVGFVEEVSADRLQYRVSDFNRATTQQYKSAWYRYDDQSGWLKTTAPLFYQLPTPGAGYKAAITTPVPGSRLAGASATFTWTSGSGVQQYWFYVGNTQGANDLYAADQGQNRSLTLVGFPTDGRRLFVRLWSLINGNWQYVDYSYLAASGSTLAQITSPVPGSVLPGSSATFTWSAGTGASRYWLYIGTTPGGYELYAQDQGARTSVALSGFPSGGRLLYFRLWSLVNGSWMYSDCTFTTRR